MANSTEWTWSEPHQDFYLYVNGIYKWAKNERAGTQDTGVEQDSQAGAQQYRPQHHQDYGYHQGTQNPSAQGYSGSMSQSEGYPSHSAYPQVQQGYQAGYYGQSQPQQSQPPQQPQQSQQPQYPYGYQTSGQYEQANLELTQYRSRDSGTFPDTPGSNVAQMPQPLPLNVRTQLLPDLIQGTPNHGWYESLDSSYSMRTGHSAHQFFKKGRVFAVLWAEGASETAVRQIIDQSDPTVRQFSRQFETRNSAYTMGRFGETVYSQIRRFVIVRTKKHFVYACPITTYSGRGTTKQGCNPKEHTIVYLQGTQPHYIAGEYEGGMTKEPIEIIPADDRTTMDPASRLRFGKMYPVEWNVKVKEIGRVHPEHMSKLISYFREEENNDSDDEE